MKTVVWALLLFSFQSWGNTSTEIETDKSLLITDLSVVNDSRAKGFGPWSFAHLMSQMAEASKMDPADFVQDWFQNWRFIREVNGQKVETRDAKKILNTWPKRSSGKLDLRQSPFRLLAIVNRIDLLSQGKPGGEGRFVFGYFDPDSGEQKPFLIILEYNLPALSERDPVEDWADLWHRMGRFEFGGEYNDRLERLTRKFTDVIYDENERPINYISQVRTNEIFLGAPWELREFVLEKNSFLIQKTTAMTPDNSFNKDFDKKDELIRWIEENEDAIRRNDFLVPNKFLGGASLAPIDWVKDEGFDEKTRRNFSLQTCNGCHTTETGTTFTHINNRNSDGPSGVSNFLVGDLRVREKTMKDILNASKSLNKVAKPVRPRRVH